MADKIGSASHLLRFKDMGDGTYAQVMVGGGTAGSPSVVTIGGATIAVPVDVQSLYRVQSVLTTATLAASAVYTSGATDSLNFRRITGTCFANVAGSLAVQQSDDNATFDTVSTLAVGAALVVPFDVPVYTRYTRLVYTNGGTIQATFRLFGYLAAA